MKKLILMSAIVLGGFGIKTASAQFGIHVNLHLGTPVYVAPQPVYDDYYYLPEVEAYYSVGENCYYYEDGGNWIAAVYLPGRRDFDWRYSTHYEIRGNRPYMQHNEYRSRYGGPNNYRAYANRGGYNHYQSSSHNQYDNRGGQSHNGYDRGNDQYRGHNGYSQPTPGNNQEHSHSGQSSHSWGGNNGQPSQGGSHSQPASHSGGHDRGSAGNGQHFTQNNAGGSQGRSNAGRPGRF